MAQLAAISAEERDDLLVERARTGLGLCLTSIVLFGVTDPFFHPNEWVEVYWIKAGQIAITLSFLWLFRKPMPRARAVDLAVVGVFLQAVTTSYSGIVTQDDVTTASLLMVLTIGTATLLPWGVRPQIVTQCLTALCVAWIGASVGGPASTTYLPIIVAVSSSFSIYAAYALERHRVEQGRLRAALADAQARHHQVEIAHAARLNTLGGMAAGLAHELNQPLAAVVSYARGCARRLQAGELPKAALLEVLEEIAAQALRAGEILRRIRDFLRGESRREWIDLNEVVRRALRLAESETRRAGVRLALELATEALRTQVDPIQIEQVILNLVQNGIEGMAGNNGTERRLALTTRRLSDDTVEVAVSDTGAGVAPDVAPRLFDPFFSTKPEGLGLGLSISRSIVEAHGGRLVATPNAPRGMTFRFTLRSERETAVA